MIYKTTFIGKLPIWGQVLFYALIALILYKIYRYFFIILPERSNYNAPVAQSQTALNQLAQQGITPSYAQAQYSTMANELQQAFDGCGAAYSSIVKPAMEKMKNDADIYALIKAYGIRTIDKCGFFTGDFEGDLGTTIGYKFSGLSICDPTSLECGSVKDINKILTNNSLIFQF